MNERRGFFLTFHMMETLLMLPPEQQEKLMLACYAYHKGEEPDVSDPKVAFAFRAFKDEFDAATAHFQKVSKGRAAAAEARWGNARGMQTDANASKCIAAEASGMQTDANAYQVQVQEQEIRNINTPLPLGETVNEDPARSPERPTGGDGEKPPVPAVDLDGPGIEFMELRDAYDAVRPEGPLDGFPEYKQLKAARDRTGRSRYPGNARLIDDFTRRKAAGFWNPGYEVGLARYLKTRLWEQPVKARASPGKPSQAEREAAEREIEARHRRLFGDRKAREATA